MYALQSTARTFLVGPILDADGVAKTDEVVASIKVTKNGADDTRDPQSTLTHSHTGHYTYVADVDDFDELGEVVFSLNSGTNAMAPVKFQVVTANVYNSLVIGSDLLDANAAQWLGTACHAATVNGVPVVQLHASDAGGGINAPANFEDLNIVDTTGLVDITQTAADKAWATAARVLTANTNLANLEVDVTKIHGSALSETSAGYLAAAFIKQYDVVTPVFTAASVNQTGDSFARIGAAGVGLTDVTLGNHAHGGAAATITLQTPIAATVPDDQKVDVNTIKGVDADTAIAARVDASATGVRALLAVPAFAPNLVGGLVATAANIKIAATTGNWGTNGTWSDGSPPSAGDNIIVRTGVLVTIAASLDLGTFGKLELQGTAALNILEAQTCAVLPVGWLVAYNYGVITTNNGTVLHNDGTITNNYGMVEAADGPVTTNYATGTIRSSNGTTGANYGLIEDQYGILTNNFGLVSRNRVTITNNYNTTDYNFGTITTNKVAGKVLHNSGTVTTNDSGGKVFGNVGTVTTNNGSVYSEQISAAAALTAYDPPTNAEMVARTKAAADYADKTTLDALVTTVGAAGAGLTAVVWNAAWDAEVQSECADALIAHEITQDQKTDIARAVDESATAATLDAITE